MPGYLKNISSSWMYAFKQKIRPGDAIFLDDLFKKFSKNEESFENFAQRFIIDRKLDQNLWELKLDVSAGNKKSKIKQETVTETQVEKEVTITEVKSDEPKIKDFSSHITSKHEETSKLAVDSTEKDSGRSQQVDETSSRILKDIIIAEDLATLAIKKAKEIVPNVNDINKLKSALTIASTLSNKDALCNLLKKRIQEVSSARS